MSYYLSNYNKWIDKYNKKIKSYQESDMFILSYDISENHRIFTDIWIIQLTLINIINKSQELHKININFDGLLSCDCTDFKSKCKNYDLPCKHLLHISECILNKDINDMIIFFKEQQKLTNFDIENIKTKIQDNNYCLMCCEQINNHNYIDKHMFTTVKSKFNCNCNCHNHCLNKLYDHINQ